MVDVLPKVGKELKAYETIETLRNFFFFFNDVEYLVAFGRSSEAIVGYWISYRRMLAARVNWGLLSLFYPFF